MEWVQLPSSAGNRGWDFCLSVPWGSWWELLWKALVFWSGDGCLQLYDLQHILRCYFKTLYWVWIKQSWGHDYTWKHEAGSLFKTRRRKCINDGFQNIRKLALILVVVFLYFLQVRQRNEENKSFVRGEADHDVVQLAWARHLFIYLFCSGSCYPIILLKKLSHVKLDWRICLQSTPVPQIFFLYSLKFMCFFLNVNVNSCSLHRVVVF